MIYIAHRGNVRGPDLRENTVAFAMEAISKGYDVELDVTLVNGKFMLGHDSLTEEASVSFLTSDVVWCHAKTIQTFTALLGIGAHCFMHDKDPVALTNRGFLWTFPGLELTPQSVCVKPEHPAVPPNYDWRECAGVCSDFVETL